MIYGYGKSFPALCLTSCATALSSLQSEVLHFNTKAHGPLHLQEYTRPSVEVRKVRRGRQLNPLYSKTLNMFRI